MSGVLENRRAAIAFDERVALVYILPDSGKVNDPADPSAKSVQLQGWRRSASPLLASRALGRTLPEAPPPLAERGGFS